MVVIEPDQVILTRRGDSQLSKMYEDLRRLEQSGHSSNLVAGLHIRGEIAGDGDLVVDGIVEGPIQLTRGRLTVGGNGKVTGSVSARDVLVHGTVTGNLQATDRVEIKPSSSVVGDVATARMVIDEGALYGGSLEIGAKR